MKSIITLLLLAFSLGLSAQETQTDSLSIDIDIIEKGFYTVWLDTIEISRHSKALKAVSRANGLRLKYPKANIKVTQPDLVPEGAIKVYAKSEPCINNAVEVLKTSDNTVIVELPNDDTGYYYVVNPDNKTLIALGKTYTNTQFLIFIQYSTGWELLN